MWLSKAPGPCGSGVFLCTSPTITDPSDLPSCTHVLCSTYFGLLGAEDIILGAENEYAKVFDILDLCAIV